MSAPGSFTAFAGHRRLAEGDLQAVAGALAAYGDAFPPPLVLDDATGKPVDLDLRAGPQAAVAGYEARLALAEPAPRPGRGRPRLGVVAREVTLLPRHWDWLAAQPGGASAALRRLVEDARRADTGPERMRQARDAAYRAMSALAGDLPGFEEASRALFAGDLARMATQTLAWPADVQAYVTRLAGAD